MSEQDGRRGLDPGVQDSLLHIEGAEPDRHMKEINRRRQLKSRGRKGTKRKGPDFGMFLLYLPLVCILYGELIFGIFHKQPVTIYKLLFALCGGLLLLLLGSAFKNRKAAFIAQSVVMVFFYALLISQHVYYDIFGTTFIVQSAGVLGHAMEFFDVAVNAFFKGIVPMLLYLAVPVLWFTLYRHYFMRHRRFRPLAFSGIGFAATLALTIVVALFDGGSEVSPRALLTREFAPRNILEEFGVLPVTALDIKTNVLGWYTSGAEEFETGKVVIETKAPTTEAPAEPTMPPETVPETTEPEPIVYEPNVWNINFPAEESNEAFAEMKEYFSNRQPTLQNEYTGIFEGMNLILMTAEGFSGFVIDPVLTPNLYKMQTEGFIFNNFYTPIWSVSTSDGEFVATTGLLPKNGLRSYKTIASHAMPLAFGKQFGDIGYTTYAVHSHSYTYYNRDLSYPAMGYEFLSKGHGIDITVQWPESDVETIELTVDYYLDKAPFHIYYMTISGHLEYNFSGNCMAYKNRARVENLDYSEPVRAYIATQMEFDDSLGLLMEKLEAAGQLENTVIAISGDHYPYGLSDEAYAELRDASYDQTFGLYENDFILWSPAIKEPIVVDTYCSSVDIAPTLSNMFGLSYDSRLYMGRDIFGDIEPVVYFQDRSFITQDYMYDAKAKKVTMLTDAEITEERL